MKDDLLVVGATFRGYVVLRKIDAGGTGEVYLARHETLGVNYAVKVVERRLVEDDRETRQRFSREVKTAARIRHPALVAVHDAGFDETTGLYFIVMDYMPGGTVADELRRTNRFSIKRALCIVRTVADGLRALNRNDVVHRDVKPSNMLLSGDGSVRLSDLGIARMALSAGTITQAGFALGTPTYMSYEQIVDSHAVDVRTDIYALGVSLYEMLTGVLPDGDLSSSQLLKKRVDGARIPDIRTANAAIPDWLAELISRMTEPDAHLRLRSLDELIATLDSRLAEMAPKKNVFVPRCNRSPREFKFLMTGVLIGFLAAAVAVTLVFEREIGRRIGSAGESAEESRPKGEIVPVWTEGPVDPPDTPETRERTVVREVVREVTNEVVRTVVVTNVVTWRVAETPAVVVQTMVTNVVEGIVIRGTADRSEEVRRLGAMIASVAETVRRFHGLPKDRRIQSRVKDIELAAGDDRFAFDPVSRSVCVGVGYGGFPRNRRQMARMCVGFMASYSEGVSDSFNDQANALVRTWALQEALGVEGGDVVRETVGNPVTIRLLELESSRDPRFLPSYFRIRRNAYADGKITGPMTVHDFAAIVSLAAGESVFPYLRRKGVKADEYATNVKARGLPKAEFFGE